MIGQQKRSLEHSVSSQPAKYQKHYDDNFCETSTIVAALTDEQVDYQQLFSGEQSNHTVPLPSSTPCDPAEPGALVLDPSDQQSRENVSSEPYQKANCGSCHELSNLSVDADACGPADLTCTKNCYVANVDGHRDSTKFSADTTNHAKDRGELLGSSENDENERSSAGGFESLSGKSIRTRAVLRNDPKDFSLHSSGREYKGFCQREGGPSTTCADEVGTADDRSFLERVQKTVEARRPNGSRPLPVFLSGKIMNLYMMHEQVKTHGGYKAVTSEGLWGEISQKLGFVPECGPGVKLIYFKYLKGLDRERGKIPEAEPHGSLLDVPRARLEHVGKENRLDEGNSDKFSLFVGEQFAESEPSKEKSEKTTLNVCDFRKKGVGCQGNHDSETEAGKLILRKERDVSRPLSHHRDGGSQIRESGSAKLHSCNSFLDWEYTQATDASEPQTAKLHIDLCGTSYRKRECGKELGRNGEESGRADGSSVDCSYHSLGNTLIWIKRMALNPGNPYMGEGVEGASQNEEWVKDCASQAEKFRGLFWKRKEETRVGDAHLHQTKQIPAPSQYYEELSRPDQQSVERFRATRERVAHYGYPGSPGSHRSFHESANFLQRASSPQSQNQWSSQTSHRLPRQSNFHSSYSDGAFTDFKLADRPRKRIPIGPDFQAQVPLCNSIDAKIAGHVRREGDETQSSDEDDEGSARWFGKQVWPPLGVKITHPKLPVGSGRILSCTCLDPESIDCVRNHVQEGRQRLEQELGEAFYVWKFDEMGECVSERWTKDEERAFRTLVKMNRPSLDKNFWLQLPDAFPGKKMKELVSYYFNVFVLGRRAIQNRLDRRHIDSDDDETELPEGDSEDSEDYDSGEELEEEADDDGSEAEDETDHHNDYHGVRRAGNLSEHPGFCDIRGVNLVYCSTNMDRMDAEEGTNDVSMNLCPSSRTNPRNEEQDFHISRQEERCVRLRSADMTSKWNHDQHDEEKHLDEHVNLLGEEELQEVKTWEDPHWDEVDHNHDEVTRHEDAAADGTCSGAADQGAPSLNHGTPGERKVDISENQHNVLGSCEVWVGAAETACRNQRDKLLSTKGMIQELFGDESPNRNSSS